MTGTSNDTWQGDAVGLVDAFRSGERSPLEELDASYAAIDASDLNAVCFADRDAARTSAAEADVSKPFGGVPIGVKELTTVAGWPDTEASVPFKDRVADHTATMVQRIADDCVGETLSPADITEETIANYLYTAGMPDPDLLIRTAGEMRISNFLLWQISYAELWVTERCWPEFEIADLHQAIRDFSRRERRYGGLIEQ